MEMIKIIQFKRIESCREEKLITLLHQYYLDRVKNFYKSKNEQLTRFAWTDSKKVRLYGIEVYNDSSSDHREILAFASTEDSLSNNKVLYASAFEKTKNPDFSKLINPDQKINWLVNNEIISSKLSKQIIVASLRDTFGVFELFESSIENWAQKWVDAEYESTLNIEAQSTPIMNFPLSNQRYFVDRYHFNDMLQRINNAQFTDEFNQCLWAYENQKWFLCASGLGSSFEHLLLIILQNYNKKGFKTLSSLGYDPTANQLISQFRKDPISISSRQERYLRLISSARNAIDHYNSGYTSKELCDLMLTGISAVYNDYYQKSL